MAGSYKLPVKVKAVELEQERNTKRHSTADRCTPAESQLQLVPVQTSILDLLGHVLGRDGGGLVELRDRAGHFQGCVWGFGSSP